MISFQYIVSGHYENLHLVLQPSLINLHGNTSYNKDKCQYSGYVYGIIQSEVSLNICQGLLVSWGKYLDINSNKISPLQDGHIITPETRFYIAHYEGSYTLRRLSTLHLDQYQSRENS